MPPEAAELSRSSPSVHVGLCHFAAGQQWVCVFVKRTYELVPGWPMVRSSEREIPLIPAPLEDDAAGTEPVACLLAECDLSPAKPCTDIVVHGHARAPAARPTSHLVAALRVGQQCKQVSVVGDRRVAWRRGTRPRFGAPEPFVALPLTWRRAFGGIDGSLVPPRPSNLFELLSACDPELHPGAFPRNPAGVGWVVHPDEGRLDGLPLPNFEAPEHPLTVDRLIHNQPENWVWAPEPAGFGWVSQTWFPRSTLLGCEPVFSSLPEHLRRGWLGLPPEVEEGPDPRFFCGAPTGLRRRDLRGDEAIEMHGFHHEGPLLTALPGETPDVLIAFRRRPLPVSTQLQTIELFPDQGLASLLWVARATPPRTLPLDLPTGELDDFDVLEGVDVLLDGAALRRTA